MYKMVGIGTDLCAIDRIERAIQNAHYTERVFTPQECAYMDAQGVCRAQSAAAMFAAKEAVAKALGTGFSSGVMPGQIEVTHEESGAPGICLHGCALERMQKIGGRRVMLSLSHEGNMAMAFAVITA